MTRYAPQWLQAGSYAGSQDRRLIGALWPGPASAGALATAIGSGSMTVSVAAGQVAVPPRTTRAPPCVRGTPPSKSPTPPKRPTTGSTSSPATPEAPTSTAAPTTTSSSTSCVGTAAAAPVPPAVPAGQVALCQVFITGGAAALTNANLTDVRPGGLSVAAPSSLPPPTSSGTTASFTDDNNEVGWPDAARTGRHGNSARRLHARWFRSAAWNLNTSRRQWRWTAATPTRACCGRGNAFVAPVAGLYRAAFQAGANPTGTGQWVQSGSISTPAPWFRRGRRTPRPAGRQPPRPTVNRVAHERPATPCNPKR